jgi:integrase
VHRDGYQRRVNAIREAWDRGGVWREAVRCLEKRRFDLSAFMAARERGTEGIEELLHRSGAEPLRPLIEDFLAQAKAQDVKKMRQRLTRFAEWSGENATVADLTTEKIDRFLSELVDLRTVPRKTNPVDSDAGAAEKKDDEEKQPAAAKGSTVNRYRAAISGLCTWAIRVGRLESHPIAGKRVEKRVEPHYRMPELSADEYRDYLVAVRHDRADLAVIFLLLLHTGADVGEVFTRLVRDIDFERATPRIRYQRTKTQRFASANKPRFVPMPKVVVEELRGHIAEHELRGSDLLFEMFPRGDVETAHGRAARAIQRPDLTLKDLRHIAAIAWTKAGTHIRLVQKWLGHASLSQTMKYTEHEPDADTEALMAERAAETLNRTADVLPFRRSGNDS